jgi:acyl-CoA thioester hydrolase
MHRSEYRVRYGDTDQMGFCYYAHYLRFFEIGRAELMRSLGATYRSIEEAGVFLPVLEAGCRYLKPARYDDRLGIEAAVSRFARASVRFGYRVLRLDPEAELLAFGFTEHCFMDRAGKPMRPPEVVTEMLARAPRVSEDDLRRPSRIAG